MSAPRLHALFAEVLQQGASDLHLAPGHPPLLRLRGQLRPVVGAAPLAADALAQMFDEVLDAPQRRTFADEGDLDFALAYGEAARFRGNLMAKAGGAGGVFRIIPSALRDMQQLGLPGAVCRLAEAHSGLVLVTGPTGSGKSTTLASLIDAINKRRAGHILTVEDPVEFMHRPQRCQVTHREVGRDAPSFADAMRSATREDADVILVGELRDATTMRLALQAATSGTLVFATVHTNSAPATVERIINAFAADWQPAVRGMLAESVQGIVAQQLLRTPDGKGRLAVHEVLLGNRAVANAIREAKTALLGSIMQSGRGEGMQLLDDVLLARVQDGSVGAAEALAKAADKASFERHPAVARALGS